MVTHYFDRPIPVSYRSDSNWHRVLALAVRRTDDTYTVLIEMRSPDQGTTTVWVPRSHVRAEAS